MRGWTCKKSAEAADVYLFWFGKPIAELGAIGISAGDVEELENDGWDWTDAERGWFCSYRPLVALDSALSVDDINGDRTLARWWQGRPFQGRPKSVKDIDVAQRLIEMILDRNKRNEKIRATLSGIPIV